MAGRCAINRDCKIKPINTYIATKDKKKLVQYIGIAIDEPRRLKRLGDGKVSLLANTDTQKKWQCKKQRNTA